MILHICEDNRFAAMAKNQFDSLEGNRHIYLINSSTDRLTHFSKGRDIIIKKGGTSSHFSFVQSKEWKAIIFHNCNQKYKWQIINKTSVNTKIIWLSWGSDIYMLPKFRNKLYKKKTQRLLNRINSKIFNVDIDYIFRIVLGKYKKQIKAYNRIDYCAPVIKQDLELLNREYNLKIKSANFSYGDLNYYLGEDTNRLINGNNILIGNSADFSNNHVEAFELIKDVELNNSKIIVPLSYGGNKKYSEEIQKIGRKLLSNNLSPLTNLIPLDDYRELLFSCSVAIMNHTRQQALGNIIMLLWMGVKIFFDESNPVYLHFLNNNILVYKTTEIIVERDSFLKPMNKEDVINNRKGLLMLYSKESVEAKTKEIVRLIDSQSALIV